MRKGVIIRREMRRHERENGAGEKGEVMEMERKEGEIEG